MKQLSLFFLLLSYSIIHRPIYEASLDVEDKIVELNSMAVSKSSQVDIIVHIYKPGDKIKMGYLHRGEKQITELTFIGSSAYQAVLFEKDGLALTPEILAFRKKWMGSKIL
jgi:predicted metalloprotease with PDZ domain